MDKRWRMRGMDTFGWAHKHEHAKHKGAPGSTTSLSSKATSPAVVEDYRVSRLPTPPPPPPQVGLGSLDLCFPLYLRPRTVLEARLLRS